MNLLKLNVEYASTLGAYWMIYAIVGSFASVFMLAKGYNNMHIGMVLAVANLLALGIQPFVADRMDRINNTKMIDISALMVLVMMVAGIGYFVFPGGSFMMAAAIVLILATHALLQPGFNSLAFRMSEGGTEVNYGIGRAGGSLGFSLILAVIGTLVEKHGEMAVPVCGEIACAVLLGLLLQTKWSFIRMKRTASDSSSATIDRSDEETAERIGLKDFIRRNKHFFILNLGIAALFFSNAVITNYMAQIARNVGGTTEQIGRILSFMALLEIPTMLFFVKIHKHISSRTLIRIASVGFTAKMVGCWLAGSVSMLYAAMVFQLFGFSLMMPGMVYFVEEIMDSGEVIKGQALFTMMLTLSTIVASLLGGWLIDAYGVGLLNLISVFVTVAGVVIVFLSIGKVEDHRRLPQD